MSDIDVCDSAQAAALIGVSTIGLRKWLSRNPEYRPKRRFSGDDLLWTAEEVEKVREARAKKSGNRRK